MHRPGKLTVRRLLAAHARLLAPRVRYLGDWGLPLESRVRRKLVQALLLLRFDSI